MMSRCCCWSVFWKLTHSVDIVYPIHFYSNQVLQYFDWMDQVVYHRRKQNVDCPWSIDHKTPCNILLSRVCYCVGCCGVFLRVNIFVRGFREITKFLHRCTRACTARSTTRCSSSFVSFRGFSINLYFVVFRVILESKFQRISRVSNNHARAWNISNIRVYKLFIHRHTYI